MTGCGQLADTELVWEFRIRLILEASGAPIQGIDQDAWAGFSGYAEQDPGLSLEAYRISRERLVRLLAGHEIAHLKQTEAGLR